MGFVISMKFFSKFRMMAVLAVALMAISTRAKAQDLWLNVIASAKIGGYQQFNLTFTISVTNLTGVSQTVVVTNTIAGHGPVRERSVLGLVSIVPIRQRVHRHIQRGDARQRRSCAK